ncbi:conserved uncharacterized protein, DUF1449 [Desulfosarcina variabilis str. Montpellier]|uniref:YqiJ family protein n=1 Tax=Desulfosarcina variabilis TaxID=2300 RepID=UPI003AFB46D8
MIAFILADQNLPFAVALTLMLLIAVLEGVTTILGMGLSSILESLMPEVDMDLDIDADMDGADIQPSSPLTRMLSWLRIGQVPVLVLLVIFLTAFGLLGFGIQSLATRMVGTFLPVTLAAIAAIVLALPMVRLLGGMLARIMPKDETEAVAEKSFIGLVAVITTGKARFGSPAQGRLNDRYGQSHYVMIEPDDAEEEFPQGTEVLLVSQQGATFRAIQNTSAALKKEL